MNDSVLQPCQWCGALHGKLCPAVKAMEFDAGGNVTRVEFMTPMDLRLAGQPPTDEIPYEKLDRTSG